MACEAEGVSAHSLTIFVLQRFAWIFSSSRPFRENYDEQETIQTDKPSLKYHEQSQKKTSQQPSAAENGNAASKYRLITMISDQYSDSRSYKYYILAEEMSWSFLNDRASNFHEIWTPARQTRHQTKIGKGASSDLGEAEVKIAQRPAKVA